MDRPSLLEHLHRPVDAASLSAFRVMFGVMMALGLTRFVLNGWVDIVFVQPTFFFKYPGFSWVRVWEPTGLYLHFAIVAVAALLVALGLFYRLAVAVFFVGFTYIQLMDLTNYLNHYYFIVLVGGLMLFLPLGRHHSLDAWRKGDSGPSTHPAWMLYLLRFQIGIVYFYAALAKVGDDWLLYAQPLNLWMMARTETPLIGGWLSELWVAYAMSWGGLVYDFTIVGLLLWRPTRSLAYLAVLVFHFLTWVFFDIGLFPFIMVTATTLFFDPDWPRRLPGLKSLLPRPLGSGTDASPLAGGGTWRYRAGAAAIGGYVLFQALVPLRHFAFPGEVLWNEAGMRFAWKVMVREKNGSVTYRVREKESGREVQVSPHKYLTWRQVSEMSGQPDMIVQLAKHIAGDFEVRGRGPVEVRVDALVSLNGRAPALMIDPDIDLLTVDPLFGPGNWIESRPATPPRQLRRRVAKAGADER